MVGIVGRCARAGIGHASAVLPRSATNSRRFIDLPSGRGPHPSISLGESTVVHHRKNWSPDQTQPSLLHLAVKEFPVRGFGHEYDRVIGQELQERIADPVFHRVPALIGPLRGTLGAVDRLAKDPVSTGAFGLAAGPVP